MGNSKSTSPQMIRQKQMLYKWEERRNGLVILGVSRQIERFNWGTENKLTGYTGLERTNVLVGFVINCLTTAWQVNPACGAQFHFIDGNKTTGNKPVRVPAVQLTSDPERDRIVMGRNWFSVMVTPAGLVSGHCIMWAFLIVSIIIMLK